MTNNSQQVFAGGWEQVQHAKLLDIFSEATLLVLLAIIWKPDGTKFYISNIDNADGKNIVEYNTITPHSTVGATIGATFDTRPIESQPRGMWWSRNGLRLYIAGNISDTVHQLNTTVSYSVGNLTNPSILLTPPPSEPGFITGLCFNADETKFYLSDRDTEKVFEYNMTPGDLPNATYSGNEITITGTSEPSDVFFKPGSSMMYISDLTNSLIRRYILSIPGNVSTAVEVDSVFVGNVETQVQGLFIREHDGKKLYVVGSAMNEVFTFDMSLVENNTIINNFGDELVNELGELLVSA